MAFVLMGYFVAADEESLYRRAVGWVCIAFFGAVAVSATWSLFRGRDVFTFDRAGITDHHRGVVIAWAEIKKAVVLNVQGMQFLGLVFHQPAQFLDRLSPLRRVFAKFNERQKWCYWNFTFTGVTPGIEEALRYIGENVPEVRVPRR
jgi:hypothetical protein